MKYQITNVYKLLLFPFQDPHSEEFSLSHSHSFFQITSGESIVKFVTNLEGKRILLMQQTRLQKSCAKPRGSVDKDRNINSRFVSYVVSNLQVPLCVGICFDGVEFSKNQWNSVGEEVPLGCVPYHKVEIGWTRILVYNCQNEVQ